MLPNLVETRTWFKDEIIPLRTASAGFSANRLWKSPRGLVTGNIEDPNGLCGDASIFVVEEFFRKYGDYRTSDGYHIGCILWKGTILNHISSVMLRGEKTKFQSYSYDQNKGIKASASGGQYSTSALFALDVYDLYYKRATTVGAWWSQLDSSKGGTVTIGLQHDFS